MIDRHWNCTLAMENIINNLSVPCLSSSVINLFILTWNHREGAVRRCHSLITTLDVTPAKLKPGVAATAFDQRACFPLFLPSAGNGGKRRITLPLILQVNTQHRAAYSRHIQRRRDISSATSRNARSLSLPLSLSPSVSQSVSAPLLSSRSPFLFILPVPLLISARSRCLGKFWSCCSPRLSAWSVCGTAFSTGAVSDSTLQTWHHPVLESLGSFSDREIIRNEMQTNPDDWRQE